MKKLFVIALLFSLPVMAKDLTGSLFPEFKLQNQAGEWISDKAYTNSWVVYYFYPKDNTPGCSIEADNFSKRYHELKSMGLDVVGISLDGVESHKSFAETYKVPFNLLADVDKTLSNQLEMVSYLPWPHARRETFIVDNKGNVVKHYQEVDPKTHVDQIITDFKTLKSELE